MPGYFVIPYGVGINFSACFSFRERFLKFFQNNHSPLAKAGKSAYNSNKAYFLMFLPQGI
jgi:hypothetical protein